ncbi:wax ester/triacylglycerol synthase family O-acyltransferase [Halorarius litoreus]|uniref:wax ester/triacylglycerol synthase family O-acyltransferase n=1 Tax=Halorarius litoreus TaxID=2962676 RepID=UPI0020CC840A|nr:wax ester/triacylglycerol synthase family O-acyltransferase [Halorarius litoreus]
MSDDQQRERLSGPDNAWFRLGERTNQMVITGVLVFDEPIEYEVLKEKFRNNLLPFKRFRQRIVHDALGRPKWELDPEFDLESHLHHVALSEPQDKQTFEEFVAGQMATQLHPDMPLWQAYLVEGAGDGNALVMRIHHSLGDGFAMIYLALGLADDPSEIDLPIGSIPDPPDVGDSEGDAAATESAPQLATADGGSTASPSLADRIDGVVEGARSVAAGAKGAKRAASMAAKAPKNTYDLLTFPDEPDTSLVGDLGVPKRVAWTDPIDLDLVRAVGEAYDATINDVLMTVTAGGFRRYLDDIGELDRADDLRVAVPVNLKPLDQRTEDLGNYFGLVYLQLPVGVDTHEARLHTVKSRMDELKGSPEPFLVFALLYVGGNLPEPIQNVIAKRLRNKATAVVTNVPGPTTSFTFGGKEVSDIFFWVPQSQGIGLGLSILSYNGSVRIGIASDAKLVSEPQRLVDALHAGVDALADELD